MKNRRIPSFILKIMKVIGIGGGSGAGKTTVCEALVSGQPDIFEIIHLDDYQNTGPDAPKVDTMTNWDHPDVVLWGKLRQDLTTLQQGQRVEIDVRTRSGALGSTSDQHKRIVRPKPFVLVEGHLALYGSGITDIYSDTFYLDLDQKTRAQRRRQARGGKDSLGGDNRYTDMVLRPMHTQHVEPTKAGAGHVIEVGTHTAREIASLILRSLKG